MAAPQKMPSDSGTATPGKGKAPPFTKKGGMGAPSKGGQSISEGLRAAMAGALTPPVKG